MGLHVYEIPRRSRRCILESEEFSPGETYYSLLENVKDGYVRKDYCPSCWKKLHVEKAGLSDGKVFWKSSVSKKFVVSEESLRRDEKALQLLKNYNLSDQQEELGQAYVLSLFLIRNKFLHLKQEVNEEGTVIQLFEVRGTEEMIAVEKVDLSTIHTDLIQKALAEKLGS